MYAIILGGLVGLNNAPGQIVNSYATGDGGGRVVFVPRAELLQQLGRSTR